MANLKAELTDDELVWGYNGPGVFNAGPGPMTDQQVTDVLNTIHSAPNTRTRNRISMTGDEVAQQAVPTAFDALDDGAQNNTSDVKSHWLALCGRTSIDPFAMANIQLVISIFGTGSQTVLNLQAARVEAISRATELNLGLVKLGHVEEARR